ncbi:MAG: selenium-binding protein SBP56-related protein [Acidobacteriota bacterium]
MKPTCFAILLIIAALFGSTTQRTSEAATAKGKPRAGKVPPPSPYLFVWAGDEDQKDPDFLAVIDARPAEPTYGEVVATLPVGARGTTPHHTEYEFPAGSTLFANGWAAGRTFIIDLSNPRKPKLAGQFTHAADYGFPHSFARLPNGNVLATFQVKRRGFVPPGGLVELDARGRFVRASSADVPGLDKNLLWPYSLTVLPLIDRVVTTSTEMGLPKWASPQSQHSTQHAHTLTDTNHIQIWSLRNLRLLATIPLPAPPQGKSHLNPAEPRVLPDGSVYINTFNCGLYRVLGVEGSDPKVEFVYSFPGADKPGFECAVPVVIGKFWIQTDPSLPGLIALDVSNPAKPVEVSRLVFDTRFSKTHWVAADRGASRLVVTGSDKSWVLIVNIDSETGKLTLDENFKVRGADHPGIDFNRPRWPHGATGKAVVHGALFGPAPNNNARNQ